MRNRLSVIAAAVILLAAAAGSFAQSPTPTATPLYRLRETMSGVTFSIGGKDYGPYNRTFGQPAFSPSYSSWLLPAWTMDDKGVFLLNGKEIPLPMPIEHHDAFFLSDDGLHYAILLVATPDKGPIREYLLADGKLSGPFFRIDYRAEASSWYAFVEKKEKGERYLLLGDKTFGPYEDIRENAVDPVTNDPVFIVQAKGQMLLLQRGKELGPYQRVEFVRDSRGTVLGYALYGKSGAELLVADKKYGPYDEVDAYGAWISPDRSAWMVRAFRKDATVLLRSGKETVYDWVEIFPRDTGYMLMASIGGKAFFTDGTREWGPFWNVFERFIPASGPWAIAVEKKKSSDWPIPVIITPTGEYPGSGLRFDGSAFTWLSVDEEGTGSLMKLPAK